MTPADVTRLAVAPIPLDRCPKCGEPFYPFLRGQVHRDIFSPWRALLKLVGMGRPTSALICFACKEIVGYEN